jgi:MFS family permease
MKQEASPVRTFLIIWFGQLISQMGSALSGFALGVWVYQMTGSATKFSMTVLLGTLPEVALAPLAGALVDRWDRRKVMMCGDAVAALATAGLAGLLYAGRLELWHIYVATFVIAVAGAFHTLSSIAITAMLIPSEKLGRANGLIQLGQSVSPILSPLVAGALLLTVGLRGVLTIDFATFLVALLTLCVVRVGRPPVSEEGKAAAEGSFARRLTYGWTFIKARPGLLTLLVLFATINFATAMVQVLILPLVLSFASPAALGTVMSLSGGGLLAGSLVMSVWGGPKRKVYGIVAFWVLQGLLLILGGWRPSVVLVAVSVFGSLISAPITTGCSHVIWQRKTPLDVQGRVFAVRRMIAFSCTPLAYAVAGPLTDRVFEPLLAPGGALTHSVGRFIGVGQGRGIGLLFILLGVFTTVTALAGLLHPRLRHVEDEILDARRDCPAGGRREESASPITAKEMAASA